jgi:hypothetical protein
MDHKHMMYSVITYSRTRAKNFNMHQYDNERSEQIKYFTPRLPPRHHPPSWQRQRRACA